VFAYQDEVRKAREAAKSAVAPSEGPPPQPSAAPADKEQRRNLSLNTVATNLAGQESEMQRPGMKAQDSGANAATMAAGEPMATLDDVMAQPGPDDDRGQQAPELLVPVVAAEREVQAATVSTAKPTASAVPCRAARPGRGLDMPPIMPDAPRCRARKGLTRLRPRDVDRPSPSLTRRPGWAPSFFLPNGPW